MGAIRAGLLILLAAVAMALCACGGAGDARTDSGARAAVDRFLDGYLDANGRVVRLDQGGDTVSEGQSYAMLAAAAVGDEQRFALAWRWTRTHLQRQDGLLSSAWRDGRVSDPQPAADADLDAVRALLLAAERFDAQRYRLEALRIARRILAAETVTVGGNLALAAGPWAIGRRASIVNPSYFDPRTFQILERETGDQRWRELRIAGYTMLDRLMARPPALPPNWATARPSGAVRPRPELGDPGAGVHYGFDAVRVLIRGAQDCAEPSKDPEARFVPFGLRLAARAWPFFREQGSAIAAVYSPNGRALSEQQHPVGYVAAAAAAGAAGNPQARDRLLDQAEALDRRSRTYYGAAWVALGRVALTTDLLGRCEA
jgi:endo-1,4-beta-D-glucanase Y